MKDPLYPVRYAVARALEDGRLVRLPCVVCGEERTDGHHEDYDKPLDVIWLCRFDHYWVHHDEAHRERVLALVNAHEVAA